MPVVGVLEWQSTIAAGAARDAAAVKVFRDALGESAKAVAAVTIAEVKASASLSAQREKLIAADIASRNKAMASLIQMQAKGEIDRAAIVAKGAVQIAAIEAKGDQQRLLQAQKAAQQRVAIEKEAQHQQTVVAQAEAKKREETEEEGAQKQKDIGKAILDRVVAASKYMAEQTVSFLKFGEAAIIEEATSTAISVAQLERLVETTEKARELNAFTEEVEFETGIAQTKTLERLNKMLAAGFGEEGALAAIRAVNTETLGVSEAAGTRLANALIKIQSVGKTTTGDIKALGKATGISLADVSAEISKLTGKSAAETDFMLKKGLISAEVGIKAVETVVQRSAGRVEQVVVASIPRQIENIKGRLHDMFDLPPEVLEPLHDALANVLDLIKGPEGEVVKDAIKDIFTVLNEALFKPFAGPEGRAKLAQMFTLAAAAGYVLADVLRIIAPLLSKVVSLADSFLKFSTEKVPELPGMKRLASAAGALGAKNIPEAMALPALPAAGETAPGAVALGRGIADGVAQGIRDGQPGVLAAMSGLVAGTLASGKTTAKVSSPSELFADELGYQIPAGVALGMDRGLGLIASSAQGLIRAAQVGAPAGARGLPGEATAAGEEGAGMHVHIHGDVYVRANDSRAFWREMRALSEGGA